MMEEARVDDGEVAEEEGFGGERAGGKSRRAPRGAKTKGFGIK